VRRRTLLVAGLLVTLLLAGVASFYASSDPDGLEKAAQDTGIAAKAEDSAADDSPLAGYETTGVDDGRISGGLAGVVGVGVTFLLVGGLVYAVRRGRAKDGAER
jgi:hypothetical protein